MEFFRIFSLKFYKFIISLRTFPSISCKNLLILVVWPLQIIVASHTRLRFIFKFKWVVVLSVVFTQACKHVIAIFNASIEMVNFYTIHVTISMCVSNNFFLNYIQKKEFYNVFLSKNYSWKHCIMHLLYHILNSLYSNVSKLLTPVI